jgi:hypothetical protein
VITVIRTHVQRDQDIASQILPHNWLDHLTNTCAWPVCNFIPESTHK